MTQRDELARALLGHLKSQRAAGVRYVWLGAPSRGRARAADEAQAVAEARRVRRCFQPTSLRDASSQSRSRSERKLDHSVIGRTCANTGSDAWHFSRW